jgi:alginate O-acetyltransferase complex protein AlgJ
VKLNHALMILLAAATAAMGAGRLAGHEPRPSAPTTQAQSFLADLGAQSAAAIESGKTAIVGKDGWLFFPGELRHLGAGQFWGENATKVSRSGKPEWADPLPAIVKFHAELKAEGIELILLPVPAKSIIYPQAISQQAPLADGTPLRADIHHQAFFAALREQGVNVLDLAAPLLAAAHGGDAKERLYCQQDTHWSPAACTLAAQLVAQQVKDRDWLKSAEKHQFERKLEAMEITGDLWTNLQDASVPKETIMLHRVSTAGGGDSPKRDASSPVLLIGDSHTLVFHLGDDMLASGSGLVEQLTFELGLPVDLIGVRGSGATPARFDLYKKASADPEYLKRKKLVIWCFSVREFTEAPGGWRPLPLKKQ